MIENTIPEKWSTKLKSGGKNVILGGWCKERGEWLISKAVGAKWNFRKTWLWKRGTRLIKGEWTKDYKESPWDALTMSILLPHTISCLPVILVPTSALKILKQLHGEAYSRGCSIMIHTLGRRLKSCGHVTRTRGRGSGEIINY